MFKALLPPLAALALSAPLHARDAADPPVDPACPRGDLEIPRGPGTICIGRLTGDYAFSFIYPAEAVAIPALDAALREEAVRAEAWLAGQLAAYRESSAPEGRMTYEAGWRIDAMTREIVAVSGNASAYTGGAHGGLEYRVILFDRRSDRRIRLADLFRPGLFEHDLFGERPKGIAAVQEAFCVALTAEVRERRQDPEAQVGCPDVEEQPITFVCGERGRIEAMRALLNPYVVGSWAEGPYEVDVPLDTRIIAAMKRRLRNSFGLALETDTRPRARPCR